MEAKKDAGEIGRKEVEGGANYERESWQWNGKWASPFCCGVYRLVLPVKGETETRALLRRSFCRQMLAAGSPPGFCRGLIIVRRWLEISGKTYGSSTLSERSRWVRVYLTRSVQQSNAPTSPQFWSWTDRSSDYSRRSSGLFPYSLSSFSTFFFLLKSLWSFWEDSIRSTRSPCIGTTRNAVHFWKQISDCDFCSCEKSSVAFCPSLRAAAFPTSLFWRGEA